MVIYGQENENFFSLRIKYDILDIVEDSRGVVNDKSSC